MFTEKHNFLRKHVLFHLDIARIRFMNDVSRAARRVHQVHRPIIIDVICRIFLWTHKFLTDFYEQMILGNNFMDCPLIYRQLSTLGTIHLKDNFLRVLLIGLQYRHFHQTSVKYFVQTIRLIFLREKHWRGTFHG